MTINQAIDAAVVAGKRRDFGTAINILLQVLQHDPQNGIAYSNLGNALGALDRLDEALDALNKAIKYFPENPRAHRAMSIVLTKLGRHEEAVRCNVRAVEVAPNDPEAHGALAHALLLTGDLKRGFAEYEWRWQCASFDNPRRSFTQPRWTGGKVAGQRLLIWAEQGFGDTIQLARYVPLLAERGATVILEAPGELVRLLARMPSLAECFTNGAPLPQVDLQISAMSLPAAFGTTLANIPAVTPYIVPHPQLVKAWREKMGDDNSLKVGISWAGRPTHVNDQRRSCSLAAFAPLASVPNVKFYSLQKGETAKQAAAPPPGMQLIDLGQRLADFDDTAAVIANLDLVITIDTAVAHLAGALGKPVWTLLQFVPDWRWMLNRNDSPWYPTMKLFRQDKLNDWTGALSAVATELRTMSERSATPQF